MKREKDKLVIQFINSQGDLQLKCTPYTLPLKEEAVINVSIEIFRDPEPCMIHRSAVMSRIYIELLGFFHNKLDVGESSCIYSDMPVKIKQYIDINDCYEIIFNIAE